jgi:PAS domain S-box-containing protein
MAALLLSGALHAQVLPARYDAPLVILSVLIGCLASYAALDLAGRVRHAHGRARLGWLAVSALGMGIGIWSMHFVGMLAFSTSLPLRYDIPLVVLSFLVAVAASAVALIAATRPRLGPAALGAAALMLGAAVAGMHYLGMAAMRMAAHVRYDALLVAASLAIAATASLVALRLALRFRDDVTPGAGAGKVGAGAVMGIAIAGMHYTGMAAVRMTPMPHPVVPDGVLLLPTDGLAALVVVTSLAVLSLAILASHTHRRVQASEQRFRVLVEHATDPITLTDETGRIRYVSPAHGRLVGTAPESLVGTHVLDRIHPEDREEGRQALATILRNPERIATIDVRFARLQGGWGTLSATLRNLLAEPAVGAIVINARDVTEQNVLEHQLRQSQKMEAVGQLAGGVAHDFNNLLTVIQGHCDMLRETAIGGPAREDVEEIAKATARATSLTRQLLAFSRTQLLQPEPLDLNHIVEQVEPMLRRLIGAHIVLRSSLAAGLRPVLADAGQIEQVLMNLVVNARDAMPGGGTLTITTQPCERRSDDANLPAGHYIALVVKDQGAGMTAEVRARIFEPFFTTKPAGRGTGLGLSTVYGIVKQSGGSIHVESEPGAGARFEILLPCAEADVAGSGRSGRLTPVVQAPERGAGRILIAEDEDAVRALTSRVLRKAGYQVFEARHGVDALAQLDAIEGGIDMLLTDVVMPEMGGPDLAERVRARAPDVPVLFMTGYTDDDVLRRGVSDHTVELLQKPFSPADLANAVRAALDRRGRLEVRSVA